MLLYLFLPHAYVVLLDLMRENDSPDEAAIKIATHYKGCCKIMIQLLSWAAANGGGDASMLVTLDKSTTKRMLENRLDTSQTASAYPRDQ